MKYLLSGQEMKIWERTMMARFHIPSILLMERAAQAVVEEVMNGNYDLRKVLIVCGTGNNGGDGLAAARLLMANKICAEVFIVGNRNRMTEETKQQLEMYKAIFGKIVTEPVYDEYTVIIDALFGIGCNREVTGLAAESIRAMNRTPVPVVSVDVPSGISSDTGKVCAAAVNAAVTVTFFGEKLGMLLYPGRAYCGNIRVAELGIPVKTQMSGHVIAYDDSDLLRLPKRMGDSHKGTYGKLLVIAGSSKMCGAAYLAAAGAYRTGAGMVKIYTPEENRTALQTLLPEALLEIYDRKDWDPEVLKQCLSWADAVVLGPGLGTDAAAEGIVDCVKTYGQVPLVMDADALNILSKHENWLEAFSVPVILTPHIQEMSRLIRKNKEEIKECAWKTAEKFIEKYPVTLVLKDAVTVVAKAGEPLYINSSGNSGMASAGSGDVLAGILGGLLVQGMKDSEAARLGVYLHGRAGDQAADHKSVYSMTASDIIDGIAEVTRV